MSIEEPRSNGSNDTRRATRRPAFGFPPLFDGDDLSHYEQLFAEISAYVKPADIIEEILTCDYIDLSWEIFRYRRQKADLINSSAINRVITISGEGNLDVGVIVARTLAQKLDEIERIERMLAVAEVRRNAAWREIERHRAIYAEELRRAVQQIEKRVTEHDQREQDPSEPRQCEGQ
jgi:hypothetical protein